MSQYRLKGTSGSVINLSFPLEGTMVLGTADDCDIRVADAGVAECQAEILTGGDGSPLLRDLADNGLTVVNGKSVKQQRLNMGDEIRVGTCRWLLQAPGLRPQRVLTTAAVRPAGFDWKRALAWALVAALAAAVAIVRFRPDWLTYFTG